MRHSEVLFLRSLHKEHYLFLKSELEGGRIDNKSFHAKCGKADKAMNDILNELKYKMI